MIKDSFIQGILEDDMLSIEESIERDFRQEEACALAYERMDRLARHRVAWGIERVRKAMKERKAA